MSKRREQHGEERRTPQVEVNLLAESEGGRVITKARQGCSLPFLGAALLLTLAGIVHLSLG